jgi:peptidoglycan/LPS O-acetylase OafA/YrhL
MTAEGGLVSDTGHQGSQDLITVEKKTHHRRQAHLDGLRALACLAVIVCHSYVTLVPDLVAKPGDPLGRLNFLAFGHLAVTVFIVISGWSLALPLRRTGGVIPGGAREFLGRRAWRIVPPYWAGLAVSTLLVITVLGERTGTHWDTVLPFSALSTLKAVLLLQDLSPSPGVPNHSYWTIAVESHIYLVFPLVVLALLRPTTRRHVIPLALALSVVTLLADWDHLPQRLLYVWPGYYALFGLSVMTCLSYDSRWFRGRGMTPVLLAGLSASVLVPLLWGWGMTLRHLAVWDLIVGPTAVALLVVAERPRSRVRRILTSAGLPRIGLFSYSIYLVHAPLLQLVWQYGVRHVTEDRVAGLGLLVLAGTVASVGVGHLFFRAVECHFLGPPPWLRRGVKAEPDPVGAR